MKWRVCRKRGGESRYISLLRYIYFDVWYTLWANGKRACGNKKPIKPTLRTIFDLFIVFGCLIRGCKRLQRVRWNHLSNLQSIKVGFISILKKGEGALLERVSSTGGRYFLHLGRMCKIRVGAEGASSLGCWLMFIQWSLYETWSLIGMPRVNSDQLHFWSIGQVALSQTVC